MLFTRRNGFEEVGQLFVDQTAEVQLLQEEGEKLSVPGIFVVAQSDYSTLFHLGHRIV